MALDIAECDVTVTAEGHQVISLPHSQKTLGLASCPDLSKGSESNLHVEVAVNRLVGLEKMTAKTMSDPALSELGKTQKLLAEREESVATAARCWANLSNHAADVAKREAELYAVPEIPPTHAALAVMDREIRDYVRSLAVDERTKLLTEIAKGEHKRITLALVRSPIPIAIPEQVAKAAWRQAIALENHGTVAELQIEHAAVEWARSALTHVARLLAESSGLTPAQIYRVANDANVLDGLDAFGFSEAEKANLARFVKAKAKAA